MYEVLAYSSVLTLFCPPKPPSPSLFSFLRASCSFSFSPFTPALSFFWHFFVCFYPRMCACAYLDTLFSYGDNNKTHEWQPMIKSST